MARLRHIANDNEKIGDEERTLARLVLILLRKESEFFLFSLIWLGSCARVIPIVCKNLKSSLELVTNITDSMNSPTPERYTYYFLFISILYFILEKYEEFLNRNEHLKRFVTSIDRFTNLS